MLNFFTYLLPFVVFSALFEFRFLFDLFSYQRIFNLAFFDLFTIYHFLSPIYLFFLLKSNFKFNKFIYFLPILFIPLLSDVYPNVPFSKFYVVLSFYIIPLIYSLFFTKLSSVFKSYFINTFLLLTNFFVLWGLFFNSNNFDFLGRLTFPYVDPLDITLLTSANWLAFLLAVLILLSIDYVKSSFLKYLNLFIASVFLIMTQSYGALLSICLVLLIKLLYVYKAHYKKIIATFLLIFLITGPYVIRTPKFKILMGDYHMPNSIERRVQLYKVSFNLFLDNIFIPLGISNFQNVFNLRQPEILSNNVIPQNELPPHPHNLLLFLLIEFGIIGIFLSLFFYIAPLYYSVNLAYYYILLHFLIDFPFMTLEHSLLFFLVLTLSLTKSKK